MRKRAVIVNDKMQKGYRYQLTEQPGRNFDPEFSPQVTPKEMLRLGVFCGKYMTDTRKEFPVGSKAQNLPKMAAIPRSTTSASMPANRWPYGARTAGYTLTIHA